MGGQATAHNGGQDDDTVPHSPLSIKTPSTIISTPERTGIHSPALVEYAGQRCPVPSEKEREKASGGLLG